MSHSCPAEADSGNNQRVFPPDRWIRCQRRTSGVNPGSRSNASMTVEVHNPEQTESKPLNTELETLAPETTAEQIDLSPETNPMRQHSEIGRASCRERA